VITTDALPATRWRSADDVRAVLDVPPAGVLIGADADMAPVVLPAIGPRPTRLGVLGDQRIAALLAYRLLGVGCQLAVATEEPSHWRRLLAAAGSRAVVGSAGSAWPPESDDPHLLVSDLPDPPDPALGDRPLCTVVHVASTVPEDSEFWRSLDGAMVAGHGHGSRLGAVLGRPDAGALDTLGPGQLGVLDRHRVVAVTPILAEVERDMLLAR
jgi:hypothetical protein